MNINGVMIDEQILESIRFIQDVNKEDWCDRALDRIAHFIVNEGDDTNVPKQELFMMVGDIFDLKDLLRPIRAIENESDKNIGNEK